jgi:hypothetical protein
MIRVENDGSVWIFLLETPDELAWVKENLPQLEPWQWTGKMSFAVDAMPASTLVLQLRDEGLEVQAEPTDRTPPLSVSAVYQAAYLDGLYEQLRDPNLLGFLRRVRGSKHHRPIGDDASAEEVSKALAAYKLSARVKREKESS